MGKKELRRKKQIMFFKLQNKLTNFKEEGIKIPVKERAESFNSILEIVDNDLKNTFLNAIDKELMYYDYNVFKDLLSLLLENMNEIKVVSFNTLQVGPPRKILVDNYVVKDSINNVKMRQLTSILNIYVNDGLYTKNYINKYKEVLKDIVNNFPSDYEERLKFILLTTSNDNFHLIFRFILETIWFTIE